MGFLNRRERKEIREEIIDDYDDHMREALRAGDEEEAKKWAQRIEREENVVEGLEISIKLNEEDD